MLHLDSSSLCIFLTLGSSAGGVKGGKVAALNARSLDILNGKFDEPSRKFALRPNPRAVEGSLSPLILS